MISGLQLIEKEICSKITDELDKVGILYRIFSRIKNKKSIDEKTLRKKEEGKPYLIDGKQMQDIIGVRIVTYFKDDVDIVYSILKTQFKYVSEEIDDFELTVFKPKRTNIICRLNEKHSEIFKEVQQASHKDSFKLIDNTFELQLRTILSEGWHEVDHSLRYKCKSDWEQHKENERMLNGIYANLETNDIVLKNLFNELAYKHYKNKNWEGLIRNKFRLNFQLLPLKKELIEILNNNNELGKQIFKLERNFIIYSISSLEISFPINLTNLVYLINCLILKNIEIYKITPGLILDEFKIDISIISVNIEKSSTSLHN
ncbi:MAG: hypothetical protein A3F72_01570 [Bacteroidetes bacterium RIFCSPLOWO2_12_FULL_35_15]|nr:MAG: hypothetical protein A3F72_01570 [Bacteroidetes bacterium RIFCSPLOWO2_12_FULL_35_15]